MGVMGLIALLMVIFLTVLCCGIAVCYHMYRRKLIKNRRQERYEIPALAHYQMPIYSTYINEMRLGTLQAQLNDEASQFFMISGYRNIHTEQPVQISKQNAPEENYSKFGEWFKQHCKEEPNNNQ